MCDTYHDVYRVIAGIYFGKVGGLLGTNNYEPLDDLLTPSSEVATRIEDVASAWSVSSGSCHADRNYATPTAPRPSDRCQNLFGGEDSPFKYCFYQVS